MPYSKTYCTFAQPILKATMNILAIETSTTVCSAAIIHNGEAIGVRVNTDGQNHARVLPVFVQELLAEAKQQGIQLDAVALSQGPGSYTGLRIGTATAKGICYGLNIPLIPIDTLQILCAAAHSAQLTAHDYFCPMIDARRMEVYCALYDAAGKRLTEIEAKVIDEHSFEDVLASNEVYFFGDGAAKCQTVITHQNAHFIGEILPLASYMGTLAEEAYRAKRFADVAYFDPFYLKEYQAIVSKNKVF